jgi:hypothetical protein
MTSTAEKRPAFEGLILEENRDWIYSFWYPKGWHRFQLSHERIGVLCSPSTQDPLTFFSVEVTPLEASIQADDLQVLIEGAQEGLRQLPDLDVELAQEFAAGGRIEIERICTFRDQEATRKRRIRLIYDRDKLYTVLSQGATEDEYTYWLPMLNYCHLTFQVGLFNMESFAPG